MNADLEEIWAEQDREEREAIQADEELEQIQAEGMNDGINVSKE